MKSSHRNRLGLLTVVSLCLGVLLLACQGQQAAPAPTATAAKVAAPAPPAPAVTAAPSPATKAAQPTAEPEVIKLGISAPLTGVSARMGIVTDRLIRMAIAEVNAGGGVKVAGKTYRFDAVTVDDKGTADGGLDAANRLVLNEKVRFIMGNLTAPTAGAQTVTEPNKVLIFSYGASDKSLGPQYPLTFQVGITHSLQRSAATYEWFAKQFPNIKTIAHIQPDDATGHSISDAGEINAKLRGLTVVTKEFYPINIKDFSPLVARVLRLNPGGIDSMAGGRGPTFLPMMKELYDQGFKGPGIGASGELSAMRDGAAFIRFFAYGTLTDWKAQTISSREREIFQRFVQQHGEADLEPQVVGDYNSPLILAQAMEKAGTVTDGALIGKVLAEGEWATIWTKERGKSKFLGAKTLGRPAVLAQPVYLSKAEFGKIDVVAVLSPDLP